MTKCPTLFRAWTCALGGLTAAFVFSTSAVAQTSLPADLQELAQAGEVVIGVREDALPFAFVDQDGVPKGYAIDICNRIVQNLRTVLGKPDLRVRYNTLTIATRTLLVRERVVDMECGATSNTRERAGDFDFSVAYGVEQAQLISPKSKPLTSLDQLRGQKLAVTTGSSSAAWLATRGAGADLVPVRNAGRGYFAIVDGQAVAYLGSGEVFLGEVLRRGGKTDDFHRVTLNDGGFEPLAVMMRKGRTGLKQVADDTIRSMSKAGELNALYTKWFQSPIASRRVAMGQPMSPAWQTMVSAPNDQPAN